MPTLEPLKSFRLELLFLLIGLSGFLAEGEASAWTRHQTLMESVWKTESPRLKAILQEPIHPPCEKDDRARLQSLVTELQVNPSTQISYALSKCEPHSQLIVRDMVSGPAIDDPDLGMDKDLPDEFDPQGDRRWIGGKTGKTSQGFRHVYFGGWKWNSPIATLQFPTRPIGQAPYRLGLFATKSREMIRAGNRYWGVRLILWAIHYAQDLTQPFHTAQLLTLEFPAWYKLFSWPPQDILHQLVTQTSRIITNFHWAYEGYTLFQVVRKNQPPYQDCLSNPEKYSQAFQPGEIIDSPAHLGFAIARTTVKKGSKLGNTLVDFFGNKLLQENVDMTQNPSQLDYETDSIRPDLIRTRKDLDQITCESLANSSLVARNLLEWAFEE